MKLLDDFKQKIDELKPDLPLTEEGSRIVMGLLLSDHSKLKEIAFSNDSDFQSMQGLQIMIRRLETLSTVKLTVGAAVFISLAISNPGQAVLYAYYIHRKCDPDQIIGIDYVAEKLFPWGMISDKQHEELWDAQKLWTEEEQKEAKKLQQYGVHDNLLDYVGTWKEVEANV